MCIHTIGLLWNQATLCRKSCALGSVSDDTLDGQNIQTLQRTLCWTSQPQIVDQWKKITGHHSPNLMCEHVFLQFQRMSGFIHPSFSVVVGLVPCYLLVSCPCRWFIFPFIRLPSSSLFLCRLSFKFLKSPEGTIQFQQVHTLYTQWCPFGTNTCHLWILPWDIPWIPSLGHPSPPTK